MDMWISFLENETSKENGGIEPLKSPSPNTIVHPPIPDTTEKKSSLFGFFS
jgi:hypothetical protein